MPLTYSESTQMNALTLIRLTIVTGLSSITIGILCNNFLHFYIGILFMLWAIMVHIKILESEHSDLLRQDSN